MEPKDLGLKLIDAINVSAYELPNKINCLNSLGYRTDVSTTFKKKAISFSGEEVVEAEYTLEEVVEAEYTLLIYKERSNE